MTNPVVARELIARLAFIATVLAAGSAARSAPEDNRLKNGGGEEAATKDKTQPAEWFPAHVPAQGLIMRLDDKVLKAGRSSLFVENSFTYPQATYNNWAQRIDGLAPGSSFTLSGWVRTENAESASMCVQAWDEGGKNLVAFTTTEPVIGTRDWKLVKSAPITIPASARLVIVRAGLGGKGKAWFDELTLLPGEGQRYPQPPVEPGANLVANPGAEDVDPKDKEQAAVWFKAQVPADGLQMTRVAGIAHAGNAALHIANTHMYPQMVCNNWTQTIPFELAGRTVKITAWVKTEDAESVYVCVQGFRDLVNMTSYGSTEIIKGTHDWMRIESKAFSIADGVTMTTIRAVLTGTGRVWFDDLKVEIVGDEEMAE